ncbi:Glycoside hydrolase 2 (Mannanase, beta-galactosidase) [Perkinsus chesapeaki]|uniref:Glycoside hydrolase 2 (Mannanase, beta-galactosidase) n=1 Tax=Perkinsus chesapeaki TaxID=330153 RepID=A0A7J6N1W7_PERCH|nr:Glycoside hydrolase 2 (Mannanase, beta-galactosidase) [Perkinsus chesapeaki]
MDGGGGSQAAASKAHRKPTSGGKAKKKREKANVDRHNPKAFTFSGGIHSVQRRVQRGLDVKAKREKIEKMDKRPEGVEAPPYVVVVQGPPGCGKTTLIRSLVKHYTKTTLGATIEGPITVVSGRNRRLTFIECPANDMRAMIDLAKVADLVLLMVDAVRGFEMETFEFINIMQVHGFPRVLGILTHLDGFKESKSKPFHQRKRYKARFWAELYDGAKMFYLSGIQYSGTRYNKTEVTNLARFIAIQKFAPLSWRQEHSYMVAHRWEDRTLVPNSDTRTLALYGYVSGCRLRTEGQAFHIAGVGDFPVASATSALDPCPPPTNQNPKMKGLALRTLSDKQRNLYAPYCEHQHITVDSEAMYINTREADESFTRKEEEGTESTDDESLPGSEPSSDEEEDDEMDPSEAVKMVRELQDVHIDLKDRDAPLPLLAGGAEEKDADDDEEDDDEYVNPFLEVSDKLDSVAKGFEDDDEDEEEGSTDARTAAQWDALVYGQHIDTNRENKEVARIFETPPSMRINVGFPLGLGGLESKKAKAPEVGSGKVQLFEDDEDEEEDDGEVDDGIDTSKPRMLPFGATTEEEGEGLESEVYIRQLRCRRFFVAKNITKELEGEVKGGSTSAEGGMDLDAERAANAEAKEKAAMEGPQQEDEDDEDAARLKGVVASKSELDEVRDFSADDGTLTIGTYAKLVFENVPAESVDALKDRKWPLILGSLLPSEMKMGFIQMRVKRHRWHPKILKTRDVLLFSVGWRRFQGLPVYALEDRNHSRIRMLKYTPEHMHCLATVYGPSIAPNTGVLAIRNWKAVPSYRVALTGQVMESAEKFDIVKKLKLVGEPTKVFKNTAFIKGMFNSDLEVSKCVGAKIQTVSGIRGEIKKAHKTNGDFRAGFEDKIKMSDLVTLKAWVNVPLPKFYNPMLDVPEWRRMRTIAELRRATNTPIPNKLDSSYGQGKQERIDRKSTPLNIPDSLKKQLPFKSKAKVQEAKQKTKLDKKAAVVRSKEDKEVASLLQRLYTIRQQRTKQRRQANERRLAKKKAAQHEVDVIREENSKENRKKRLVADEAHPVCGKYAPQGHQAFLARRSNGMCS